MKRRRFIRNLIFIPTISTLYLQSCHDVISGEWEGLTELVRELCGMILPSGGGVHIEEMKLDNFVMVMLADCYGPDDKKRLLHGVDILDSYCKKEKKRRFLNLSRETKQEMTKMLNQKDPNLHHDIQYLFDQIKKNVILGFTQSKLIMHDRGHYELAPGRYNGHYKIA